MFIYIGYWTLNIILLIVLLLIVIIVTKCTRNSIDHKNKLHAIYSKNPSLENNLNYTKYRNNLTSILRVGERNYYAEQIEINKHDLKKSWKIIKDRS